MTANGTVTYEFRVEGQLDDHWSAWLGGLTLTRQHDGTTTLVAAIADQAQLHGLLARLRDIGATLLSLRALQATDTCDEATEQPEPQPGPSSASSAGRSAR